MTPLALQDLKHVPPAILLGKDRQKKDQQKKEFVINLPVKIVITKRYSDYHACPEGEPGCWAAGKTIDDAIGNLVRCHPERFNVQIVWPTPLDRLQRSL